MGLVQVRWQFQNFRQSKVRPRGQNWSSSYHHGGDGGARDGEPQPHCDGGDGPFEQQGTDAEVWYCVELLGEKNSGTNPIILRDA